MPPGAFLGLRSFFEVCFGCELDSVVERFHDVVECGSGGVAGAVEVVESDLLSAHGVSLISVETTVTTEVQG